MTFNKALRLISSIEYNLDEGMMFNYDLTNPDKYKLTMVESSNGQLRQVTFKLRKGIKKMVYVHFVCEDFRFNFPVKKNIDRFVFNIKDFTMLLKYGIKADKKSLNDGIDLDVEF